MKMDIKRLSIQEDPRGWSLEILKRNEIDNDINYVYLIITKPGTKRGNHYHLNKGEWLCVIKGTGMLVLEDNKTKERAEIKVNGKKPELIKIPNDVAHTIINTGKEEIFILELANKVYDKDNPDTFKREIA